MYYYGTKRGLLKQRLFLSLSLSFISLQVLFTQQCALRPFAIHPYRKEWLVTKLDLGCFYFPGGGKVFMFFKIAVSALQRHISIHIWGIEAVIEAMTK